MRSLFLFVICICLSLQLSAQLKPMLTGHIKGLPNGTKVWIIGVGRDSAVSKNGTFVFYEHGLPMGDYNLRLSREWEKGKWKDFLVDKTPLVITASDTLLHDFAMSGSDNAKECTEYERYINKSNLLLKISGLLDRMDKAFADQDTTLYARLQKELKTTQSAVADMQWAWVNKHKSSLFTNFLIYTSLRGRIGILQLDSVLATLPLKDEIFFQPMRRDVDAYKATAIGATAPVFVQNDIEGKPFRLESLRGSYVFVDFWASWCVPCREENPNVLAAYNRFKGKLRIVGVSLDDKKDLWKEAVQKDNLPWLQLSDLKGWENEVSRKYFIHSIPANVLISPEGKIIAKDLRGEKLAKTLEELIK